MSIRAAAGWITVFPGRRAAEAEPKTEYNRIGPFIGQGKMVSDQHVVGLPGGMGLIVTIKRT